jgi:hydrogenase maturation factor
MCVGEVAVVTRVDRDRSTARVRVGDAERTVSCVLHPMTRAGDRVLVHTGFVVEVLDGDAPPPGREHATRGGT